MSDPKPMMREEEREWRMALFANLDHDGGTVAEQLHARLFATLDAERARADAAEARVERMREAWRWVAHVASGIALDALVAALASTSTRTDAGQSVTDDSNADRDGQTAPGTAPGGDCACEDIGGECRCSACVEREQEEGEQRGEAAREGRIDG